MLVSDTLRSALVHNVHDDSIQDILSHFEPVLAVYTSPVEATLRPGHNVPLIAQRSTRVVSPIPDEVALCMPRAIPRLGSLMQLPFRAQLDVASLERQIWFTTPDMRSLTLVSTAYHRWVENLAQKTLLTCDVSPPASPEFSDSDSEPDTCCLCGLSTATSICAACEQDCRREY